MSTFTTLLTNTLGKFTLPTKVSDLTNDKNYVSVMDRNAILYDIATDDVYCKDCWYPFGQYQETLTITNTTITIPSNSQEEYGGGGVYRVNANLDDESEAFEIYYENGVEFTIELTSNHTAYIAKNNNNPNTLMTQNVPETFQLDYGDEIYISTRNGNATFNYTVKTYQEIEIPIQSHELIDIIYPIGSIYTSLNDVNPSLLFGGYWEKIQGQFLLASGTEYNVGETGGSEYTILTVNELPSHTHIQNSHTHTQAGHSHKPSTTSQNFLITDTNIKINETKKVFPNSGTSAYYVYTTDYKNGIGEVNATNSATPTINGQTATNQNTGSGGTHSNMPPYLVVHMWKRMLNVYDTSKWNNNPTVSQADSSITCNAVKFVSLNEEFTTANHYTLTYDVICYGNREGLYFFSDPTVTSENGWHFVRDIYNSLWQWVENNTVITEENLGKNYHTSGTHKVILIRNGDKATLFFDEEEVMKDFDVTGLKNTIGINKWQNGSIQIKNFNLKLNK